jgi:hypothetical protein
MYIAENKKCDSLYLSVMRKQKLKEKQKRTGKLKSKQISKVAKS